MKQDQQLIGIRFMLNDILNKKIKQYINDHIDVYFQVEHH